MRTRSGIVDEVHCSCDIERISEGAETVRVGGSTIDASKHIACAAFYDGDPWELVLDRTKITEALPVFTVLTISATGSEMNPGAVISNEETKEKIASLRYIQNELNGIPNLV